MAPPDSLKGDIKQRDGGQKEQEKEENEKEKILKIVRLGAFR